MTLAAAVVFAWAAAGGCGSKVEFDASASAVAITAAAQASAGTTGSTAGASTGSSGGSQRAKYYKGTAIFVHTKGGLMFEASVSGQKFSFKPVGN